MKLVVHEFLSLDGVMQGPGDIDEDRSNGFDRGGWIGPFADDESQGAIVDSWFDRTDTFLLGRTTYDLMHAYWSQVTDPDNGVATALNNLPKLVVSSTLQDPEWNNATVLIGDLPDAVSDLKARDGGSDREASTSSTARKSSRRSDRRIVAYRPGFSDMT